MREFRHCRRSGDSRGSRYHDHDRSDDNLDHHHNLDHDNNLCSHDNGRPCYYCLLYTSPSPRD